MSYNEGRRSSLPSRPNKQRGDCQACSDVNNAAGNRPSMQQRGGSPNVQGTSPRNQRSWQQAKHATTGWNPKCTRDKPKKPTQLTTGQACNKGVEPQMYKGQAQETNAAGNRPSMQQKGWNPKCTRDKPKKPTQLTTGQACNKGVEPQMYKGQAQEQNNNKLTKMTQQGKKPAYNNWTTITALTRTKGYGQLQNLIALSSMHASPHPDNSKLYIKVHRIIIGQLSDTVLPIQRKPCNNSARDYGEIGNHIV